MSCIDYDVKVFNDFIEIIIDSVNGYEEVVKDVENICFVGIFVSCV